MIKSSIFLIDCLRNAFLTQHICMDLFIHTDMREFFRFMGILSDQEGEPVDVLQSHTGAFGYSV